MIKKNIIVFLLLFIILLNTQVVNAANDPDYDIGYKAGLEEGQENSNKSDPIVARRALQNYKDTDAYKNLDVIEEEFEKGFIDGYNYGLEIKEEEKQVRTNYADVLGTSLGSIYGAKDFQEGRASDWKRSLPSDRSIINIYNLNVEKKGYIESFLETFILKFEEAYNIAFEKANFEPIKTTLIAGVNDGEKLGKLLGSTYGAKDYFEDLYMNFERDMLDDRDIIINYSLNNDYSEYKEGFISGFKRAYEIEYNKIYREANIDNTLRDERDAYRNGQNLGEKMGEMQATNDFMEKKSNDWRRSQKTAADIITQYSLTLQSPNYRQGFISGFQDGYSQGYNSKYQSLSQDTAMDQTVAEIIPISGGDLTSHDGIFTVTIDKGTFYNPVNLTLDTIGDYKSYIEDNYIKGSEVVRLTVLNTSGALDNEKPIELKFEYYGDVNKSGIYKWVNGNWLYLTSYVEDGFVKTIIKPKSIKEANGIYAVLLNTKAPLFHDIRGHWAKEEINTLIKRNIIYGYTDKTFKPENKITRAEFLTLLSRVYNWQLPTYTANTIQFKDYTSFHNRNSIISYALAQGYIQGYPDNTFRPNDHISYREVEIIMRRLVDKDFNWHHTSAKMLYEKKTRSLFYDSIDFKINRGEVSFMLYILNDWRY